MRYDISRYKDNVRHGCYLNSAPFFWYGKNLLKTQEENTMFEVYYAEDDETIGKSVKEYLEQ